jgi:hypothetical protein
MGASFNFNGKLISSKGSKIQVQNVVANGQLAALSEQLDSVLASGDFKAFCSDKV